MGRGYSMDLRARIAGYIAAGHLARAAGRIFGISASTAVRLAAAARSGDLVPKRQGRVPGTAGKLALHRAFLAEIVAAEPDITLGELAGALKAEHGLVVRLSSLHRARLADGADI